MSDVRHLTATDKRLLAAALKDPAVEAYVERTRRALSRLRVPKARQDEKIAAGIGEMLARRSRRRR